MDHRTNDRIMAAAVELEELLAAVVMAFTGDIPS
jgi:hypothetical protein